MYIYNIIKNTKKKRLKYCRFLFPLAKYGNNDGPIFFGIGFVCILEFGFLRLFQAQLFGAGIPYA